AVVAVDDRLSKVSADLANYKKETGKRLNAIERQLNDMNGQLTATQNAMNTLESTVDAQGAQLRGISDVLYSRSSSADRLTLLRAGHLKGVLDEPQRKALITAVEFQASRERIGQQFGQLSSQLGQIAQIASNLKIGSPEVSAAISTGAVAANAIA